MEFAGAVVLLAQESSSAPPIAPGDGGMEAARTTPCSYEVKGIASGRGACTIEYTTYPPEDGGFPMELTSIRIVAHAPVLRVELTFHDEPKVGPPFIAQDGGQRRLVYGFSGSARVERGVQVWNARSHVESDFHVAISSFKSTCNDGGLKCWEIHGRVQTSVPSELLGPYAEPLALSVSF